MYLNFIIMKKTYPFLFACLALLFSQCQITDPFENLKEEGPEYFLSFKADGRLIIFSENEVGALVKAHNREDDNYAFLFYAMENSTSNENSITYLFSQESSELIEFEYPSNDAEQVSLAIYKNENGVAYSGGRLSDFAYGSKTAYTLHISSLNADIVEGTFEAKLYSIDLEKYVLITEGKFILPYVTEK